MSQLKAVKLIGNNNECVKDQRKEIILIVILLLVPLFLATKTNIY